MRTLIPADHDTKSLYFLLNSLVVPRPIAWVSTRATDGTRNLAPHSYFTVAASDPPSVAFTSIGDKDTVTNVRATGEFVVHVAGHDLVERMNLTSANAPADVDEFTLAGLDAVDADLLDVPVVAQAPIAIECRLTQVVEVGNGRVVIGECVAFHVAERLWDERDRVDPGRLDAIARMGGSTYSTTRDRFELRRPSYEELVTE
ncbi:MAG: flavin reductase family protein [Thermoleophilia bacterium]|nr:flavin reductase family protein [Thermoleophilia bacterium]